MSITTPEWVKHSVFYQIFPDRFARSSRTNHPDGILFKPWGSPPEEQGFQGGDLRGIVDRLDYLQELSITALYLNPIFASAANHRYQTFDYMQVDPLLGGNTALRELLDEAHRREMYVVLDGVFNHASRGFWPFHHILENGVDSPYIDWFIIHDWPLRPYSNDKYTPANYEAWWDLPALPKLNTDNPAVRDYIYGVARYWLEFGIDGWRLDVPEEIDDGAFWCEFRRIVKEANPNAYLCGEIWGEAKEWLGGDRFDAVMNYLFTSSTLSFFGANTLRQDYSHPMLTLAPSDAPTFARQIKQMQELYDWEINYVQLNLLDSHDMARALWILGENKSALRSCVLFQMTMPGAPCIYYGDEIGLSSDGDPYCREAFPWDAEDTWDQDLLAFYRKATALRHNYPVLRTGTFQNLYAAGMVYAFYRRQNDQDAVVVFNCGETPAGVEISMPEIGNRQFGQIWPDNVKKTYLVNDGRLDIVLPARDALVLIGEP
jgi:neopullulanase